MTYIDNEIIECANILLQLKYGKIKKIYNCNTKYKTHQMTLRPRFNK